MKIFLVTKLRTILFSLFILFFSFSSAQETIISYDVIVGIEQSGLINVTEKIKVNAEGGEIRQGIKRSLPLYREDKFGEGVKVKYDLKSTLKNNNPEPFFTQKEGDYWVIYIGQKGVYLENGIYEYQIEYSIPDQIGFFDKYDELYWNVTGNEWSFPIQNVSCQVILPQQNNYFTNAYCYTGIKGSQESNCDFKTHKNTITFKSRFLNVNEGLTIAATFPKDIVEAPEPQPAIVQYFNRFKHYIWTIVFGLGTLLFYLLRWKKFGKDEKIGAIIPEFRPPFNWSPSIISYILKRETSKKAFMAAVVNLAVKKKININTITEKGIFTISEKYEISILSNSSYDLSPEEEAILKEISSNTTAGKLLVDKENADIFQDMNYNWSKKVNSLIKIEDYYKSNSNLSFNGFLIFILLGLTYVWLVAKGETNNTVYAGLIILGFLVYYFKGKAKANLFVKIIFYCSAFFIMFMCIGLFIMTIPFLKAYQIATIVITFIAYLIYTFSIGKYSPEGNEALRRIKGFKLYLETAEKNVLQTLNPPALTPQLFEELLPYAIALDIEDLWGEKFSAILDQAQYQPDWYNGTRPFTVNHFTPSLYTSLDRSSYDNSSSSSSGGSSSGGSSWSSGSSGSGSSGGGGGGGGGGGW